MNTNGAAKGLTLPDEAFDFSSDVRSLDIDSSGELSFAEFRELVAQKVEKGDEGDILLQSLRLKGSDEDTHLSFFAFAQHKEEAREAFELFDKDKSGKLDKDELRFVLRTLGSRSEGKDEERETERALTWADEDLDGTLGFQEFEKLLASRLDGEGGGAADASAAAAFAGLADGAASKISVESLKKASEDLGVGLTDKELEQMIIEADVNGDGLVSQAELTSMLNGADLFPKLKGLWQVTV